MNLTESAWRQSQQGVVKRTKKSPARVAGNSVRARLASVIFLLGAGLAGLGGAEALAYNGYKLPSSGGAPAEETPKELEGIGIDENLGAAIDLHLSFKDEADRDVVLGDFVSGHKPMLLSLAYFGCPSLCSYHLNGLNDAFRELKAPLGSEFEMVVVSIDPKEGADLARQKRDAYVEAYGRPDGARGWHFLTGSEANIRALARQVGFKYRWDETQKQWAHASAAIAITPEGKISRYLNGIVFDPKVMRLSLIEASNGAIGTIVDKLTLFCFHFDPKENKYTVAAFNIMRAGGGLTALILAAILVPFWFRSRRESGGAGRFLNRSKNNGVQGEA